MDRACARRTCCSIAMVFGGGARRLAPAVSSCETGVDWTRRRMTAVWRRELRVLRVGGKVRGKRTSRQLARQSASCSTVHTTPLPSPAASRRAQVPVAVRAPPGSLVDLLTCFTSCSLSVYIEDTVLVSRIKIKDIVSHDQTKQASCIFFELALFGAQGRRVVAHMPGRRLQVECDTDARHRHGLQAGRMVHSPRRPTVRIQ
jgi:hypothetical protein